MRSNLSLVWVAADRPVNSSPSAERTRKSGNGHHTRQSTILVVEDELLIRLAISDYLRDCGYRVLEAAKADDAQRILRADEPVEVLFSDIDLGPGMNGFALARWVRQEYPAVRIVLTSGVVRSAEDAAELCDGPFVRKPYSYEMLADQIKQMLARFQRSQG